MKQYGVVVRTISLSQPKMLFPFQLRKSQTSMLVPSPDVSPSPCCQSPPLILVTTHLMLVTIHTVSPIADVSPIA